MGSTIAFIDDKVDPAIHDSPSDDPHQELRVTEHPVGTGLPTGVDGRKGLAADTGF